MSDEIIKDDLGHIIVSDLSKKLRTLDAAINMCRPGTMRTALQTAKDVLGNHKADRDAYNQIATALTDLVDALLAEKYANTPSSKSQALALRDEALAKALPLRETLDRPVKP